MSKNKSQVWSLDSIIASVIFVTSVIIFILILTNNYSSSTQEDAQRDNSKILQIISGTEELTITGEKSTFSKSALSFLIGPNINVERLKELQDAPYNDLKSSMGIRGDFCIFFEDMNGNIINISEFTDSEGGVGLGDNNTFLKDSIRCSNQ